MDTCAKNKHAAHSRSCETPENAFKRSISIVTPGFPNITHSCQASLTKLEASTTSAPSFKSRKISLQSPSIAAALSFSPSCYSNGMIICWMQFGCGNSCIIPVSTSTTMQSVHTNHKLLSSRACDKQTLHYRFKRRYPYFHVECFSSTEGKTLR